MRLSCYTPPACHYDRLTRARLCVQIRAPGRVAGRAGRSTARESPDFRSRTARSSRDAAGGEPAGARREEHRADTASCSVAADQNSKATASSAASLRAAHAALAMAALLAHARHAPMGAHPCWKAMNCYSIRPGTVCRVQEHWVCSDSLRSAVATRRGRLRWWRPLRRRRSG